MNTDSWFWGFCTVLGNLSCTPCKIPKTKNQYFFFQVLYVKRAPRKLATKFLDLSVLILGFHLHHSTQSYAGSKTVLLDSPKACFLLCNLLYRFFALSFHGTSALLWFLCNDLIQNGHENRSQFSRNAQEWRQLVLAALDNKTTCEETREQLNEPNVITRTSYSYLHVRMMQFNLSVSNVQCQSTSSQ